MVHQAKLGRARKVKEVARQRKRYADREVGCAKGDRCAEAQPDKGMSQTKVKSCMYASKLLTERSPVVKRVNKVLKGWGAFYSVGYPSRVFRKVNHYVLKRMARFLNRKSQRYYRLRFADTYYGEMTHYGLYRLAWADVRRTRD